MINLCADNIRRKQIRSELNSLKIQADNPCKFILRTAACFATGIDFISHQLKGKTSIQINICPLHSKGAVCPATAPFVVITSALICFYFERILYNTCAASALEDVAPGNSFSPSPEITPDITRVSIASIA